MNDEFYFDDKKFSEQKLQKVQKKTKVFFTEMQVKFFLFFLPLFFIFAVKKQ